LGQKKKLKGKQDLEKKKPMDKKPKAQGGTKPFHSLVA